MSNNEILCWSATQIAEKVRTQQITAEEVTNVYLAEIERSEPQLHAFITVEHQSARQAARRIDDVVQRGEDPGPLAGVPLALKDIIVTRGLQTTAGSKILDGWIPPYDATVTQKLRKAGTVTLGKTNMDEFAMGSSTENSAFGPSKNPWNLTRTPGGSSGGTAAAVAGGQAALGIGTDTGGSIRQPASFTGLVGHRPTYGTVSRHGLIAFSSSLDQAGPMSRDVSDAAALFDAIAGHDPLDSTSLNTQLPSSLAAAQLGESGDLNGVRVGVVRELAGDGFEAVAEPVQASVDAAANAGAKVVEISCPHTEYALATYYLIAPSEASSNLARFDSVRYGLRAGDNGDASLAEVMAATRDAGFGAEVKRRIIIGTYALSSGYYDEYYGQAQKVRTLIARDYARAFEEVDVLLAPTVPIPAFSLGELAEDPIAMYATDLCTLPTALAGVPALSVPVGFADDLPVGVQVIAPQLADDRCFRVGAAIEAHTTARLGKPLLDFRP